MPVWQKNAGFDLFSTNDIAPRVGLLADLDLVHVTTKTPLSIELGWTTESYKDSVLASHLTTELVAHNFHGGLKLRHQILSFLAPHLHAGAGASWLRARYDFSGASVSRAFESHEWVAFGMVGGGVTATIPTGAVVQPGLVVEGGYLISGAMPLRLEPKPNDQAIATTGATLGELGRSGPYLRFGVFLRY
jgi:hypothetical protein